MAPLVSLAADQCAPPTRFPLTLWRLQVILISPDCCLLAYFHALRHVLGSDLRMLRGVMPVFHSDLLCRLTHGPRIPHRLDGSMVLKPAGEFAGVRVLH